MSKRTQKESGKESHSKVKTNDEFDYKGSLNSVIFCIRKPGEEKLRKSEQFVIGDETELDLPLGSRSFLDKVNDQVRKKAKTIFNECYRRQRKTFCDMVNVHVSNIGVICIHVKELLRQLTFHE